MELKPAKTFEEQVQSLIDKNINVDNFDDCIDFLKKVNYYRFSAYYLPFKGSDGKCTIDLPFNKVKKMYEFDRELRILILRMIEDIEVHIRTQVSYYHAHKYGPDGYMLPSSHNKRHDHIEFTRRMNSCIYENRNTLIVKHHTKNYECKFPLWVMIEFFSIGMLSHFYRGMINADKAYLASSMYGTNYQTLESWLRCLTDLRNMSAHHSRLYYYIFPALPKMPRGERYIPTRRIFAQLYMLKLMHPSSKKWNDEFVKPLGKLIKKYKPYISLDHLDFPYRWKSMLTK